MTHMLSIAIYDPRRLSEKDFLAGFVARNEIAEFLLEQLRKLPDQGEATHRLLVGQRGMGKTSLLRRIAIGIAHDPILSARFVPLTFREEQYNVRGIEQFWKNCGEFLAEWLDEQGDAQGASKIDANLNGSDWRHPQASYDALLACVSKTGRRPVLLVDNFDLILDAIPSDQHWQLRRALQSRTGPVLYGAASQFLRQAGDQRQAFYEFFQIYELEPLSERELLDCIRRLVNARGSAGNPVRDIVERKPERLRVLHTLTGGNPRVLVLIYQLLERVESASVIADLEILLDQMTPFYRSRIEELKTELPRAILDAVALNWDPITSNALAKISGEPITTVSSQLSRLRKQGLVEEVSTSGSRSGYQIVERFFNIWYLMRHGTRRTRLKMRWFAAFLQSFYSLDQLRELRQEIFDRQDCIALRPYYEEAIAYVIEQSGALALSRSAEDVRQKGRKGERGPESSERVLRDEVVARPNSVGAWRKLGKVLEESGKFAEAETAYRRAVTIREQDDSAWRSLARFLKYRGKFEEAEAAYHRSLELKDHSYSWSGLGHLLLFLSGRDDEAETAFAKAIERNINNDFAWWGLGQVQARLMRYTEAEISFKKATSLDPHFVGAWEHLANLQMHPLKSGKIAEKTLRRAIRLNPKSDRLFVIFGHLLDVHLDRPADAEAAFRKAIDLAPKNGQAWASLGRLLGFRLNRIEEAEDAFRKSVEMEPNSEFALSEFGDFLVRLDRLDEAEALFQRAIQTERSYLPAWMSLGELLHDAERYEESENAFKEAVKIDANNPRPWISLGELAENHFGRLDEAEKAFRRATELDQDSGLAWSALGHFLLKQKRAGEAEIAFRRAIDTAPNYALGWIQLGNLLLELPERKEETEAALRKAIECDPNGYRQWALLGSLLREQFGRYEEAASAFRRALEINPKSIGLWIALGNVLQDHLGHSDEAEAAYRHALDQSSTEDVIVVANLFWLKVKIGDAAGAASLRPKLVNMEHLGQELADAAIETLRDNFGEMTKHLNMALSNADPNPMFFDDLLRLLRLIKDRGYGPRLIEWFKQEGHESRHAAVYAAFVAFNKGRRALLDVNPEIRRPAERIFDWLSDKGPRQSPTTPKRRLHRVRMH